MTDVLLKGNRPRDEKVKWRGVCVCVGEMVEKFTKAKPQVNCLLRGIWTPT